MSAVILAADNVGQYYADTSDKEDQQPTSTNKQSKNINSYIMDNSMIMTTRSSTDINIAWVGGHYTIQGHWVPIKSQYVISY